LNQMNENAFIIHVPKYLWCTFEPQEDITAYELSKLMPFFAPGSRGITEDDWSALGEKVTRHLRRHDTGEGS